MERQFIVRTYILWLLVGAILMICFGYILKYTITVLLIYILVYKPSVDYYYIKKMNLFKGHYLILKYPFWGYGKKLLFGK